MDISVVCREQEEGRFVPVRQTPAALSPMAEAEGITEKLKASDQMEWVREMNSIRNRAMEIVNAELIFA